MTLDQLSPEEKLELKQNYLSRNEDVSYGELADADELVTDDQLRKEYGNTDFVPDDFFCNQK